MRPVKIAPGYLLTAEGSVLMEVGNTRVLCAATVEESIPQWLRGSGRGWVTAEYSLLPRSTVTRTPREVNRGKPSGRTMEIQRLIGRSLRAVVDLEALGERSLVVDCDVLQADGGTRTASITGAFVAMALAIRQMRQFGTPAKDPIKDFVAATSVGVVGGGAMIDLDYDEDSSASVDMNVVMTGAGEFVEIQATGEKSTYTEEQLHQMLVLARAGISELIAIQKAALQSA
jgi:ribonuclease PH